MRGKPEKVKFRLGPGVAHVARERIWHPTQELREIRGWREGNLCRGSHKL